MKHHYIPEFYSKQWAGADGKVLRYRSLPNGRIVSRRLAPAGVGYGEDIYRAPFADEERAQALEKRFFQLLDNRAAQALAALTEPGLKELPMPALGTWIQFSLSLLHRSPVQLESIHATGRIHYNEAVQSVRDDYASRKSDYDPETFEEFVATQDEARIRQWLFAAIPSLILNQNILRYCAQLYWFRIEAAEDCRSLLLSDEPVFRTNGLMNDRGHFAMPLNPSMMLVGTHTWDFARHIQAKSRRDTFSLLNTEVVQAARGFVIAADHSHTRFIENRFGKTPRKPLAQS